VHPWLKKAGTTFRTLVDQHNEVGKAYSLKFVPVAIIVDAEGRLVRPVVAVNIGDDDFRAELESWATTGDIPAAWRETETPESRDLTPAEREADARFQLALVLLETERTEEALEQLRLAVHADPENWLIRKQMWAIEAPEAFYEGNVDYAWQKARQEQEEATLLRQ
jgi:tetratricopeptide (TPR) repeat protein